MRPKPMVELGSKPILHHVMDTYAKFGVKRFVILLGYKGWMIKDYFSRWTERNSDLLIRGGGSEFLTRKSLDWEISLIETGEQTMTGGRLLRAAPYLEDTFFATYGDGLGNVDLTSLLQVHQVAGRVATVTTAIPHGRFGSVALDDRDNSRVSHFREKPSDGTLRVSAGYFVFEKSLLGFLDSDQTVLEQEPLSKLASQGQLSAHFHQGFWKPMDTLKDKLELEDIIDSGAVPWLA